MTGAALALIGRVVGLFGFKLSGFWAGAIVAGLLAVSVAVYSGFLVHAGYDWAEGKCEAASLRDDNARLMGQRAVSNIDEIAKKLDAMRDQAFEASAAIQMPQDGLDTAGPDFERSRGPRPHARSLDQARRTDQPAMKLETQILIDAGAFTGEWRRDLIAVAVCMLIMVAVLAIQEWSLRRPK